MRVREQTRKRTPRPRFQLEVLYPSCYSLEKRNARKMIKDKQEALCIQRFLDVHGVCVPFYLSDENGVRDKVHSM